MRVRLLAALCVSLGVVALAAKYDPTKCLEGENHKEAPSPEGNDYKACLAYRDRTCCTAKFTEQLAQATVTSIDNFHWDRCGALSKSCEAFMIHVECFYRCSPNVNNWANPAFPSAMKFVPVCGSFCDRWYSACRKDLSCATDWISDWNYTEVSGNQCRDDAKCLSFETRYSNGKALCEKMWGLSFLYVNDTISNDECLMMDGVDFVKRNDAAVKAIFDVSGSERVLGHGGLISILCTVFWLTLKCLA